MTSRGQRTLGVRLGRTGHREVPPDPGGSVSTASAGLATGCGLLSVAHMAILPSHRGASRCVRFSACSPDDEPEEAWRKLNRGNRERRAGAHALRSLARVNCSHCRSLKRPRSLRLTRETVGATSHAIVVALVDAATRERPLLILFEDAHWADGLSLELLAAVLAARPRIMAVVTSREPSPSRELSSAGTPGLDAAGRTLARGGAERHCLRILAGGAGDRTCRCQGAREPAVPPGDRTDRYRRRISRYPRRSTM